MSQQNIVIVGAGIVGLSTAYALLRQGAARVTVLEQAVVDHSRSTSHGISRLLRFEYGPDPFYTRLVQLGLAHWRMLEHISRRTLYSPTGLLVLGNEDDDFTSSSYSVLRELGLPTTRLSQHQCKQRFPQFVTDDYDMYTYNMQGGILHASTCLRTLRDLILDLGGEICEVSRVKQIEYGNYHRPVRITLASGEEYSADRVVLAVGPWIHHLMQSMRLPVRMTRQYLLYFADLPIASFGSDAFPAFLAGELYGFPLHSTLTGKGPSWFKAASHNFGIAVEPEESTPIEELLITQIAKRLRDLLPALRQASLVQVDACMYDVSLDEDFILDTLPDDARVVFATGLSGHGFKFGLVLGEILCSLVQDSEPPVAIDRFKLSRFIQGNNRVQQHSSVA
ncbi:MAG: N-methyl-L-tryptophan oxidase [Ktedonobacteraceae bacterium]